MVDITIGQYYPEDSVIHKLDPRVKLFGTLVFVVMVFMINNVIGYGLITLFLGIVIKMSKVPFKKMMKGIRGIIFIMLLSVVFNIFLTPGMWLQHITTQEPEDDMIEVAIASLKPVLPSVEGSDRW